jgi:hypothetical protein
MKPYLIDGRSPSVRPRSSIQVLYSRLWELVTVEVGSRRRHGIGPGACARVENVTLIR